MHIGACLLTSLEAVECAFIIIASEETTVGRKNICMHNYIWQAVISLKKTLVYCAFSILCNNWAIIEYAVKHICVVRRDVCTLLENADLNLARSPPILDGIRISYHSSLN